MSCWRIGGYCNDRATTQSAQRFRLPWLVQPHSVEQILKPWVFSDRIEEGMHLHELQDVGVLLVGPLEPHERLVVLAECKIRVDERAWRNILRLLTSLQFVDQLQGLRAMSGARVRCRQ